jgi:NitT/TauT family transport system permease protein
LPNPQTSPLSAQELYIKKQKRTKIYIRFAQYGLLLAFLVLWELSASLGWIDSFIFSSPSRLIACAIRLTKSGELPGHIAVTLMETFVSFFLVIVVTLFVTLLLWLNRPLSRILEPYLVVLNSLPKSALAPLLIVWLGANYKTIILTGMSVAIFGSILNLYTGFMETSPDKIKLIRALHGNTAHVLFKVVLPSNLANLFSIMKVNIGLCLIGVIIGEFIGSKQGLGYMIIYGSQVFKLDWVILSILILCLIAMLLYFLLGRMERKFL